MSRSNSSKRDKKAALEKADNEPGETIEIAPADVEVLPPEQIEELEATLPIDSKLPIELPDASPVAYDSLQTYLQEIARYPTLTKEEESELAIRYLQRGDLEAAYRLVVSNLRLVVMIAREYQRAARNIMDLIQEGNIGLMEAVKKFDPYRGVRFPSYAVWWIRAYVVRYVMNNWRMVKIGTTQSQRKLFFNLAKEKERLEKAGFLAEPKLLAEKLSVKESEIIEMQQRLSSPDLSIDAPLEEESDSNLLSVLPAAGITAEESMLRQESRQQLKDSFDEFQKTLNPKELAIFKQRLLGEEKATLDDLAVQFKLSRERIRQIETRLLDKLKAFLKDKFADIGIDAES